VYTIDAGTGQLRHFHYSRPLPHQGGTDAISIFHGQVLVSASAPGTTGKAAPQPSYPAVYQVSFDPASRVAHIRPVFYDEAKATVANRKGRGSVVRLGLTDPDSNEVVPFYGPRFPGDFMLTSQGDKEQIFLSHTVHPGSLAAPSMKACQVLRAWCWPVGGRPGWARPRRPWSGMAQPCSAGPPASWPG
jgi:hypothetical protein